jgi:murein endopeptidase
LFCDIGSMIAEQEPTAEAEDGRDESAEQWHENEEDDKRRNDRADVHRAAPSLISVNR